MDKRTARIVVITIVAVIVVPSYMWLLYRAAHEDQSFSYKAVSDPVLQRVRELGAGLKWNRAGEVERLWLGRSDATPVDLAWIGDLPQLVELDLQSTHLSDERLSHLASLAHLKVLNLGGNRQITSAGMQHVAKISSLRWLDLQSTRITDEGLRSIQSLSDLEHVYVGDTYVTDPGVQALKQALPNCEVHTSHVVADIPH